MMPSPCPESCSNRVLQGLLEERCRIEGVIYEVTGYEMSFARGVPVVEPEDPASYGLDAVNVHGRPNRSLDAEELERVNEELTTRAAALITSKKRLGLCSGLVDVRMVDGSQGQVCEAEITPV